MPLYGQGYIATAPQLCIGWTLAFVLVVGSILILSHCGPGLQAVGRQPSLDRLGR